MTNLYGNRIAPRSRHKQLTLSLPKLITDQENYTPPHSTFTRFPDLPAEIRINIWRFAAAEPRIVSIYLLATFTGTNPRPRYHDHPNQSKVPAILHTSVESRQEALKFYELCDEGNYEYTDLEDNNTWAVFRFPLVGKKYINFSVDKFIGLANEGGFYNFSHVVRNRIKHLEIHLEPAKAECCEKCTIVHWLTDCITVDTRCEALSIKLHYTPFAEATNALDTALLVKYWGTRVRRSLMRRLQVQGLISEETSFLEKDGVMEGVLDESMRRWAGTPIPAVRAELHRLFLETLLRFGCK